MADDHRALAEQLADTAAALLDDAFRPEPVHPHAPSTLIEAASAYALLAGVRLQLADSAPADDAAKGWPHPVGKR